MLELTPASSTAAGLQSAHAFAADTAPAIVAKAVGCGYEVSCQDTVPFAIWNACRSLADSREAPLSTVEVGGDCDTNAAIVCGIVTCYGSSARIPQDWRIAREPLPAS